MGQDKRNCRVRPRRGRPAVGDGELRDGKSSVLQCERFFSSRDDFGVILSGCNEQRIASYAFVIGHLSSFICHLGPKNDKW